MWKVVLSNRSYTVQLCEIHLLSFIFWKVSWKQFFFCQFMKNKSPNHSLTYTICIIYKCTSFYFILNNFNLREKNDNHLLCDSLVYSIFHSNNALDLSNFHIIFHSYYYVFFYYVVKHTCTYIDVKHRKISKFTRWNSILKKRERHVREWIFKKVLYENWGERRDQKSARKTRYLRTE